MNDKKQYIINLSLLRWHFRAYWRPQTQKKEPACTTTQKSIAQYSIWKTTSLAKQKKFLCVAHWIKSSVKKVPKSDQRQFSQHKIHKSLRRKAMRILKMITNWKRKCFYLLSNSSSGGTGLSSKIIWFRAHPFCRCSVTWILNTHWKLPYSMF